MIETTRATRALLAVLLLAATLLYGCGSVGSTRTGATATVSEQDIVKELNAARTNPKAYARLLEQMRPHFYGTLYHEPGKPAIRTQEGLAAVDEAIRFLRSVSPSGPLVLSPGLSRAALDHVRDTGPKGIVSHTGSDGSTPRDRVERYGRWQALMGETIAYAPLPTARSIVIQLIVDDGVPGRGHRTAIFNPVYRVVGVASGPHRKYGTISVQEFAGGFRQFRQAL